jgi:hypothetical protein
MAFFNTEYNGGKLNFALTASINVMEHTVYLCLASRLRASLAAPFLAAQKNIDIMICKECRRNIMKRQIIVYIDMEGASGIFDHNINVVIHGSSLWLEYGKKCITSDVFAVCPAANECKIDEILIYDGHFAVNTENNIILEMLPNNVIQK